MKKHVWQGSGSEKLQYTFGHERKLTKHRKRFAGTANTLWGLGITTTQNHVWFRNMFSGIPFLASLHVHNLSGQQVF